MHLELSLKRYCHNKYQLRIKLVFHFQLDMTIRLYILMETLLVRLDLQLQGSNMKQDIGYNPQQFHLDLILRILLNKCLQDKEFLLLFPQGRNSHLSIHQLLLKLL